MLQLSAQDSQFLYMETGDNLSHVTSVNIYDPSTVPGNKAVGFKEIIERIRERMPMSPFLKRKLVSVPLDLDYPYWADDEYFDLEAHIQHSRLPEPSDWRQFCIQVARYHSRPLNMNRPAWEMHVIEGLSNVEGIPEGAFAIATKIHHAAADGGSLAQFFGTILDIDNQGTPCIKVDKINSKSTLKPTPAQMANRAVANNFGSPIKFLRTVGRATPAAYKALSGLFKSSRNKEDAGVPFTRFNVPMSPHKVFDSVDFPLKDFKNLRSLSPESTINDVVLSVISGTLRRYLTHHNELPKEPLHAYIPVNARKKDEIQDDKLGNNLAQMIAPIHSQIADPLERLNAIVASTVEIKARRKQPPAVDAAELAGVIPNATQILASRLIMSQAGSYRSCNLFVSNVMGSPVPNYFVGAKSLKTFGLAPLNDGMGLFISSASYDGQMIFSVVSTRKIMPDIAFFMDCMKESMQEFVALLDKAPEAPKAKLTKKKPTVKKSPVKKTAAKKATNKKSVKKSAAASTTKKNTAKNTEKKSLQKKQQAKRPRLKKSNN